jgi:hypothetical protein
VWQDLREPDQDPIEDEEPLPPEPDPEPTPRLTPAGLEPEPGDVLHAPREKSHV